MKLAVMAGAVALAALGSGCLISPVVRFGGGKSVQKAQRVNLDRLLPAQIEPTGRWTGEVRIARVRVWADDDYRAQNVRWQHGVAEQLDDVNQVLTPMLGIRIEAEYHAWDHHAPGASLSEHLDALARLDPGDDVVWVIGFTSSLSLVAGSFEQIGVASLEAPHAVVRGHADLEERTAFERAFPAIDREQREWALAARRRHKTTALLLHELAHSLGALHEVAPDRLMSPSYSHHAASIDERNRALMQITLEDRLRPPAARDPRGTAEKLLAALDLDPGGWDQGERAQLSASLRTLLGGEPGTRESPASSAMAGQLRHAEELLAAGDAAGARTTLAAAEAKIAELPADQARIAWLALAEHYRDLGSLTFAERALARAGTAGRDHPVARWARATRARYGIPRDGARYRLGPDDEADALAAVHDVLAMVNADRRAAAARAAAAAERRWPGLPGLAAARCDLELRRQALAAARQQCARAIAHGESSWALYLSGILELAGADQAATSTGIARLRAAIELDPDLAQAWRALGKALARRGADAELAQLRGAYQAHFGEPLPR